MSNKVRAAIIGCGNIAGAHGPAYKAIADHVELAYCIDLIPERAEEKKAAFGDENTVCLTDYREMLKKRAGLEERTMDYLAAYQYGGDLIRKLATMK